MKKWAIILLAAALLAGGTGIVLHGFSRADKADAAAPGSFSVSQSSASVSSSISEGAASAARPEATAFPKAAATAAPSAKPAANAEKPTAAAQATPAKTGTAKVSAGTAAAPTTRPAAAAPPAKTVGAAPAPAVTAAPAAAPAPAATAAPAPEPTAVPTPEPTAAPYLDAAAGQEVVNAINALRSENGLPALSWDSACAGIAESRAQAIVANFSHDGFLTASAGTGARAENIAANCASGSDAVAVWAGSDGHRANMLGAEYTTCGAACYVSGGSTYWVAVFGV